MSIQIQDMHTAPKDGTRIMIRVKCYHYRGAGKGYEHKGYAWTEGRFIEDQWEEWRGTERTRSSRRCDPVAWYPVPEDAQYGILKGQPDG